MPFTPPTYPTELTSKFWDKKKGLIARMKNDVETGIGKAADEAQALFKKIDWSAFDYDKNKPAGFNSGTEKNIAFQEEEMQKAWRAHVKPLIEAVQELGKKATEAVTPLKTAKYPDAAKGAGEIAQEAKSYTPTLQPNGVFFSGVAKLVEEHRKELKSGGDTGNSIAKGDPKQNLAKLIIGVKALASLKLPQEGEDTEKWIETWNSEFGSKVKNAGRSLTNGMKVSDDPKMKQHLKVWVEKFNGFTVETMPEFRDFNKLSPAELMVRSRKLLVDVANEANRLKVDL